MLTISRDDISSTELTEFPIDKRFIKLPVETYLKLLPAIDPSTYIKSTAWQQVNGPQLALINAINNPKYRFVCAALARRLGKTYISNIVGQLVALVPGCNILIMSPNYNLSSISFEIQRKLIKSFDLEVEKDNAKDRIIELSNGSTIRMGSLSTVDSCVGRSYVLIIFDEAALGADAEEAFNVSLRPTLDKPSAKAIFISTPRGKNNWFSKFFQRGFSDEYPKWVSVHSDYRENPRNDDADIEEAKKSMSSAHFKQEYEASFNSFEGQIFRFNTDRCLYNLSDYDFRRDDVIMGLDIGFKDATAGIVLSYNYEEEKFYAIAEYLASEKTTDQHAEAVKALEDRYNIQFIFIDSAAQQTRFDWASNHDISTINANKSVLDGIAYCQALIENDRLIVDESCTHLLAALDQYRWDPRDTLLKERPEHSEWSHMADALRYALYSYTTSITSV